MRKESFARANNDILNFFKNQNIQAYTSHDIQEIFEAKRNEWKIASYRNYKHFITFLKNEDILLLDIQNHEKQNSVKQILRKKTATPFDVGLTVKKGGYLSNYSAMQLHQITLQIPKVVYISEDKYAPYSTQDNRNLLQSSVDRAFSKPQRISTESYKSEYDSFRYIYLQRKHNSINTGITKIKGLAVTDLERTLIDIAVRPAYSGGAFQIVEAFRSAKDIIDLDKIDEYLNNLDYIYPYHQLIGFYLDKAGFTKKDLTKFAAKKSDINMYQTYNLTNKVLNKNWGVYHAIGLESI